MGEVPCSDGGSGGGGVGKESVTSRQVGVEGFNHAVSEAKLQRHGRLQSLRDRAAMSCLGNEARRGAEMAAEKIHRVSGGGRQEASGAGAQLLPTLPPEAWGCTGGGSQALPGSAQLSCGAAVVL